MTDEQDTRQYFVSVIDGTRYGLLLGPFPTHEEALSWVRRAKHKANELNAWAAFYAYGTCKAPADRVGILNKYLLQEAIP